MLLHALYRKSNICIPRKGIARPQFQFLFMFLWAIYIFPGSVHIFGCSKIDIPILEIYKSLTDIWVYRNWETEHYNAVLEIRRLHSFISGNTLMGTRHLFWILTSPSFAKCDSTVHTILGTLSCDSWRACTACLETVVSRLDLSQPALLYSTGFVPCNVLILLLFLGDWLKRIVSPD